MGCELNVSEKELPVVRRLVKAGLRERMAGIAFRGGDIERDEMVKIGRSFLDRAFSLKVGTDELDVEPPYLVARPLGEVRE
jgi:hypothetical protein